MNARGAVVDEPISGAPPAVADARVHLRLLDSFELSCEGRPVSVPLPAQRLLAFLALNEHLLCRAHVAGVLWLDVSDQRAAGSLRSALWRVRRLDVRLVEVSGHRLRLAPGVGVDVRDTVGWAHRVLDASGELDAADVAQIWGRDVLLPDWYDDWVADERERLRSLRAHALECLCQRLAAVGRFGEATEAGLAAIRDEPLRESAHRALIAVHLAEGNPASALKQYHLFARLLGSEVGLRPSARMEELVDVARRREPAGLSAGFVCSLMTAE